jgi:hypothetical protein
MSKPLTSVSKEAATENMSKEAELNGDTVTRPAYLSS